MIMPNAAACALSATSAEVRTGECGTSAASSSAHHRSARLLREDRRKHGNDMLVILDARVARGELRHVEHVRPADGSGEIFPEFGRRGHVQCQPFAVMAFKHIALADMRAAGRTHDQPFGEIMGEIVQVEMRHGLEHRGFDEPPLAGCMALVKRGEDAIGGVEASQRIGNGRADHARMGGIDQEAQEAARACATVSKAGRSRSGPSGPKPEMLA